jgi:CDP-diacylglycerol--serine O-phosphatidyltransferase
MVSNFRYTSFKSVDFRGRVPFGFLLLVVMVFALLIRFQEVGVLAIAVVYALSAPSIWLFRLVFDRKKVKSVQ